MPVLMTVDMPVSRADLEALSDQLSVRENLPVGLIMHVATEHEGAVRVVDVWESQADMERFRDERLNPAIERLVADRGIQMSGPPPEPVFTEAFDLVRGA
jgi:hypothetical protein